jgi:hypothetical protein
MAMGVEGEYITRADTNTLADGGGGLKSYLQEHHAPESRLADVYFREQGSCMRAQMPIMLGDTSYPFSYSAGREKNTPNSVLDRGLLPGAEMHCLSSIWL